MERFITIYKYFLIALTISLFLFIFYHYFSINGRFNINSNFCKKSSLLTEITPTGRALEVEKNTKTGECYQRLTGEPVYFTATAPRSFNTAAVTLSYKNPSQNIVELGIQKGDGIAYDLKPFENRFIDNCSWDKIIDNNVILFQKEKKYNSINDFLNNLPLGAKVATYNYQPKYKFTIPNYQPESTDTEFNQPLRGKHELYTYLENEDLDFTFYWQLLNSPSSPENFNIKIYKDNIEIDSFFAASDNTNPQEKRVTLTNLSGGLYKIILDVSDNVIVTKIKSKQHLLVAKDKIFLADNNSAITIFSNIDEATLKTDYGKDLQTVMINNEPMKINIISTFFPWQPAQYTAGSVKEINAQNGNLVILGKGYFALTEQSFFDPDYGFDQMRNNMDIEQYDYIIAANYQSPVSETGWKSQTVNFDLNGVPGDRKTLNFIISAPGLENAKDDITVKGIDINLQREPLTLNALIKKIFNL